MVNPLARVWRRVHDSLAFRTGTLYRLAFSSLPIAREKNHRPQSGFTYLTLSGLAQMPMLRASLWSLRQATHELPRLVVARDASLTKEALLEALDWWPGPIETYSLQDLQAFADETLPEQIALLCRKHIYGLKAAAIMRAALSGPVFYADTDVLWFKGPQQLLPPGDLDKRPWLRLQEDRQMAYDSRLVELWPFMNDEPFYCAGVMIAHGDLRDAFAQLASPGVRAVYESPQQFSEQTTFAALQRILGNPPLGPDDAYLSWDDQLTLAPSFGGKPWVLRHYVGPVRHIFWRDVFFMYFLNRRPA